jgi:hypothetical protein
MGPQFYMGNLVRTKTSKPNPKGDRPESASKKRGLIFKKLKLRPYTLVRTRNSQQQTVRTNPKETGQTILVKFDGGV